MSAVTGHPVPLAAPVVGLAPHVAPVSLAGQPASERQRHLGLQIPAARHRVQSRAGNEPLVDAFNQSPLKGVGVIDKASRLT